MTTNGILTKDGYRIVQHEYTHEVMIFRGNRILKKIKASRTMKERELLDLFDFVRYSTVWEENNG